jgi:ankyrin repeat protein
MRLTFLQRRGILQLFYLLAWVMRLEMMKAQLAALVKLSMILFSFLLVASCNSQSSFPDVRNDKLLISLQRTACYGSCPDYKVTIDGQGNVVFTTRPPLDGGDSEVHREFSNFSGVRVSGTYPTVISKADVASLLQKFKAADFFSLKDEYSAAVTDNPTYILSIDTGNGSKTVVDYVGEKAGMPRVVTTLQDAVDKMAGTDRWIKGLPSVIPILKATNAEFDGIIGLELMDAAAERGDLTTLRELKAIGAPFFGEGPTPLISAIYEKQNAVVNWLIENGALEQKGAYERALDTSVSKRNHEAFDAVIRAGGQKGIPKDLATRLLQSAAGNADLKIVNLMLANGANPNGAKGAPGMPDPPLFDAANGIMSDEQGSSIQERRQVVNRLLNAGADTKYCLNNYCSSVLWQVSDREIAKMLLDAAADPNFRDSEGEHILFNISDEQVALLLIQSGADLKAVRPADGMTLRKWAKYEKWPAVIELLNKRGL